MQNSGISIPEELPKSSFQQSSSDIPEELEDDDIDFEYTQSQLSEFMTSLGYSTSQHQDTIVQQFMETIGRQTVGESTLRMTKKSSGQDTFALSNTQNSMGQTQNSLAYSESDAGDGMAVVSEHESEADPDSIIMEKTKHLEPYNDDDDDDFEKAEEIDMSKVDVHSTPSKKKVKPFLTKEEIE